MDADQQKIFLTHHNYVSCLEALSRSMTIDVTINKAKPIFADLLISKKIKLIQATKEIINIEQQMSLEDAEFASAFCPWLPAKIYYLLFHCWCIVDYLITTEENRINSDHQALWSSINEKIGSGKIIFSEYVFNQVHKVGSAIDHVASSGDNLRQIHLKDELRKTRIPQVLKKVADYKLESAKHLHKIKSFMSLKGRGIRNSYYEKDFTLLDFFYQYRLKTNYRDLSFLADDLEPSDAQSFTLMYLKLGRHHYTSVRDLINKLSEERFSKKLL